MIRRLAYARAGTTAAEFALTLPILVLVIFGIIQIAILYWAQAGLENAVGEGARLATLWPRQTDAAISARIVGSTFGIETTSLATPSIVHGTTGGKDYVDITVTYNAPVRMSFVVLPSIALRESKRVYLP